MVNTPAELPDYRDWLRSELESRCRENPRYSLRAFARDLKLAPPRVSALLNRKQGLSRKSAAAVAERLGFGHQERERFCDLVDARHSRSPAQRKLAATRVSIRELDAQTPLTLDAFAVVSDWYHFAILELVDTYGFQPDAAWIGRKLGIGEMLARSAIDRLFRLDMLVRTETGAWRATEGFTAAPVGITAECIRKFHRQVLERALTALSTQAVDQRDFSTMVVKFDTAKLPEARELLRDFRRSFTKKLAIPATGDSVYALSLQLFRLDEANPNLPETSL